MRKLKAGAPFLLYLYYAFDNRPWWFRSIWRVSDSARRLLCRLPFPLRSALCDVIAAVAYLADWSAFSAGLARLGLNVDQLPLSAYRHRSFYAMRNDALDRFGTRLSDALLARRCK